MNGITPRDLRGVSPGDVMRMLGGAQAHMAASDKGGAAQNAPATADVLAQFESGDF